MRELPAIRPRQLIRALERSGFSVHHDTARLYNFDALRLTIRR